VVVGVNEYLLAEERSMDVMRIDPRVTEAQLEKLSASKRQRDNGRVAAVLERLRKAASSTSNLIPIILEAVECDATLGEISEAMRDVFGEYREKVTI
jgi:methylmalonyl-CoA mutase N-terminal domain/subunit